MQLFTGRETELNLNGLNFVTQISLCIKPSKTEGSWQCAEGGEKKQKNTGTSNCPLLESVAINSLNRKR